MIRVYELFVICLFFTINNADAWVGTEDKRYDSRICFMVALQKKIGSLKAGENMTNFSMNEGKLQINSSLVNVKLSSGEGLYLGFISVNDKGREFLINHLKINDVSSKNFLKVESHAKTKAIKIIKSGDPSEAFELEMHYKQDPEAYDTISIEGNEVLVKYQVIEYSESDCKKDIQQISR